MKINTESEGIIKNIENIILGELIELKDVTESTKKLIINKEALNEK